MWAFCFVLFIGNFWLKRLLNILEAIAAIWHVVSFLVLIITLLVMAQRSTASFVFKTLVHNAPGWTNQALHEELVYLQLLTHELVGLI
jgi:choline transport protein